MQPRNLHETYQITSIARISRTAIGLRVKDGIVLAVEKITHSKLLMPESNKRILTIDRHIGFVRRNRSPLAREISVELTRRKDLSGLIGGWANIGWSCAR
jgi:Proteasome subunit